MGIRLDHVVLKCVSVCYLLKCYVQILIGAIIENSPADKDGRLRPGDELLSVDGIPVAGKPHRYVIDLMHGAARNGQVKMTIRRRVQPTGERPIINKTQFQQD